MLSENKAMRGKKYQAIKTQVPVELVDISTAVAFLKEHVQSKFDETVEVHIRLGVDASQSEQMVRGNVTLPHGSPKEKKIVVFTADTGKQAKAKEAGATLVGGEELITKIASQGSLEADVTVATPDMMPKIAKVAKILGPQGLMPNPKTGTVTPDPASVVKELKAGKVSFKMDNLGNIHEAVAKVSWDSEKIIANTQALIVALRASRPAAQKGEFLRSVTLKTTMSPAIRISL
jgi:large subunit ribosomal protein L1